MRYIVIAIIGAFVFFVVALSVALAQGQLICPAYLGTSTRDYSKPCYVVEGVKPYSISGPYIPVFGTMGDPGAGINQYNEEMRQHPSELLKQKLAQQQIEINEIRLRELRGQVEQSNARSRVVSTWFCQSGIAPFDNSIWPHSCN
jgi:hypothetical protein